MISGFNKLFLALFFSQILFISKALAHCPLCVVGAGAIATGASFFGVKDLVTGVFIGAFAIAIGLLTAKMVRTKHFKYQDELIVISCFVLTILPVSQIIKSYLPIYISWVGNYGSMLNRTYLFNSIIVGSLIGAIVMSGSSRLDKIIRAKLKRTIPFQRMIVIFASLLLTATILQFI